MITLRRFLLKPQVVPPSIGSTFLRAVAAVHTPAHKPITVPPPKYAIKESTEIYQVDMKIPRGFTPEDIKVKVDPKEIHVEGTHGNKHFEEHFTSGHDLDVSHLEKEIRFGNIHLEAPKTYMTTPPLRDETKYLLIDHEPITTQVGYDVKQSMNELKIDMDIPFEFTKEDVTVTIAPDKKHIHVCGTHNGIHFDKTFSSGRVIDVARTKSWVGHGHVRILAPVARTVVAAHNEVPPSTIRPPYNEDPVTVAPGYDVKENNDVLEVDMNIPLDFNQDEISIEVEPDQKHIHVSGRHGNLHFDKSFDSGHALDKGRIHADLTKGRLHIDAPKDHP